MRKRRALLAVAAAVVAALAWWLLAGDSGDGPSPASPPPGPPPPVAASEVPSPRPEPEPPPGTEGEPAPPPPEAAPAEAERRVLLRARVAGTRAPLPGARVWLCAFRVHGAEGPLGIGQTDPGHHPACVAGEPLGTTGEDGTLLLDLEPDRFLHAAAAGYAFAKFSREADGSVAADFPPGGAVRLLVRRWGELEEPIIVAYGGEVDPEVVPERPIPRSVAGSPSYPPSKNEADPADGSNLLEVEIEPEIVMETEFPDRDVAGPTAGEEVLVEGLDPGTWTFFVERGARGGEVYARGSVVLPPAGEVDLVLDALPTTAGSRGPVTATVHVDLGKWGRSPSYMTDFDVEVATPPLIGDPLHGGSPPFLLLRGLDLRNRHLEARGASPKAAGENVYTVVAAPDLPPGRYRATVDPPGWSTEVAIAEGSREILLRVPDPAETEVLLTDALSGRPIGGRVLWSPLGEGSHRWVEADAGTGVLLLRAPPGTYRCSVSSPGHRNVERTLTLVAGPRGRVDLALEPAASVRVLLRADGAPYVGEAYVHAEMKFSEEEMERLFSDPEAQESGIVTGQSGSVSKGEVTFENLTPGTCEIRVDPVPGFAPVPPRTVQVHAGRVEEVAIDLTPE